MVSACPSPEMPARCAARRGRRLLTLAASALLVSCAGLQQPIGGPAPSGTSRARADDPASAPVLAPFTVVSLRGSATLEDGARRRALKPTLTVGENQPVQVGPGSQLRLDLGQRAQVELGPGARLVVHRLPRAGAGDLRATWLRLERGQMRVLWKDEIRDAPVEVSFARWAARLAPGDHFFEGDGKAATACSARGQMRLSGVPEWTAPSVASGCARLAAQEAPRLLSLQEEHWLALRSGRSIERTLARAEQQQLVQQRTERARAERARLEQEREARRKEREIAAVAAAMDAELKREEARAAAEAARLKREAAQRDRDTAVAAAEAARLELERAREAAEAERLLQEARAAAEREAELDAQRAAAQAEVEAIARERLRERETAALAAAPTLADAAAAVPAPDLPPEIQVVQEPPAAAPLPEPDAEPVYVQPLSPEEYAATQPDAGAAPIDALGPLEPPPAAVVAPPAPVDGEALAVVEPVASAPSEPTPVAPADEVAMAAPPSAPPPSPSPEPAPAPQPAPEFGSTPSALRLDDELGVQAQGAVPAPPQELALAPPATATPESEGLPEPVPLPKPEWIVNVQTYSEAAPAQKQAELLGARGVAAVVRYETVRGRPSFRVVIEGLPTADAAEAMVADLQSRLDIDSAWSLRRR